ncbi:Vps62-related protein [Trinickia sp. NRRL B-1857]|uniref:Vps62-related protein n=1 Tax=Trinickia sp. NRRL B-1857 TaxID=3162879 RepID=UPI003D2D98DC
MLQESEVVTAEAPLLLPGVHAMGNGYDVNGVYATPESFVGGGPLFDFGSETYETQIAGQTYRLPNGMRVQEDFNVSFEQQISDDLDTFRYQLGEDVGVEGGYQLFSASLDVSFEKRDQQVTHITLSASRLVHRLWIISLEPTDVLRDKLRPDVKRDLNDPKVSPNEIFKRYGAYFVAEGVFGGRVDHNSATRRYKIDSSMDLSETAKASLDAKLGRIGFSQKTELQRQIATFQSVSNTRLRVVGGDPAAAARIENEDDTASAYVQWAGSLLKFAMLTAFTSQSLRPIWDLAQTEARKNEIAAAFQLYMASTLPSISQIGAPLVWIEEPPMGHDFTDRWSFAQKYLSVFHPNVDSGFQWVGQSAQPDHQSVAKHKTPILKDAFDLGLLRAPNTWFCLWSLNLPGTNNFSCWRATPPNGYRALGDVFVVQPATEANSTIPPDLVKDYACVHEDLCEAVTKLVDEIWNDVGTATRQRITLWTFKGKEGVAVNAHTFVGVPHWEKASNDDLRSLENHIACLRNGAAVSPKKLLETLEQFPELKQWVLSREQAR